MNTYKLPTHLCDFRFVLASGPGGQHVNKTATAVELRIPLTKLGLPPAVLKRLSDQQGRRINKSQQLIVQASRYRSQLTNKEDAIARAEKFSAQLGTLLKPAMPPNQRPLLNDAG